MWTSTKNTHHLASRSVSTGTEIKIVFFGIRVYPVFVRTQKIEYQASGICSNRTSNNLRIFVIMTIMLTNLSVNTENSLRFDGQCDTNDERRLIWSSRSMVIMVKLASWDKSRPGSFTNRTFESVGGYMRQKQDHQSACSWCVNWGVAACVVCGWRRRRMPLAPLVNVFAGICIRWSICRYSCSTSSNVLHHAFPPRAYMCKCTSHFIRFVYMLSARFLCGLEWILASGSRLL